LQGLDLTIKLFMSLNISKSAFYSNMDLMDSIKKAHVELRENVSNSLLSNATSGDTTSLIFLAKRLNLFSEDVSIKLTSPKSALKSLEEVANANISLEHKNSLKSIRSCRVRTKSIKTGGITTMKRRIEKLENTISQNKSRNTIVLWEGLDKPFF
jgi:hypothetical protein